MLHVNKSSSTHSSVQPAALFRPSINFTPRLSSNKTLQKAGVLITTTSRKRVAAQVFFPWLRPIDRILHCAKARQLIGNPALPTEHCLNIAISKLHKIGRSAVFLKIFDQASLLQNKSPRVLNKLQRSEGEILREISQ